MGLVKKLLLAVLLLLIALYGALFTVENDTAVPLDLLLVELPAVRLSLWVVAAFIAGGVMGLIISSLKLLQSRGQYQLVCRKLAKAEKELNQLKSSALKS